MSDSGSDGFVVVRVKRGLEPVAFADLPQRAKADARMYNYREGFQVWRVNDDTVQDLTLHPHRGKVEVIERLSARQLLDRLPDYFSLPPEVRARAGELRSTGMTETIDFFVLADTAAAKDQWPSPLPDLSYEMMLTFPDLADRPMSFSRDMSGEVGFSMGYYEEGVEPTYGLAPPLDLPANQNAGPSTWRIHQLPRFDVGKRPEGGVSLPAATGYYWTGTSRFGAASLVSSLDGVAGTIRGREVTYTIHPIGAHDMGRLHMIVGRKNSSFPPDHRDNTASEGVLDGLTCTETQRERPPTGRRLVQGRLSFSHPPELRILLLMTSAAKNAWVRKSYNTERAMALLQLELTHSFKSSGIQVTPILSVASDPIANEDESHADVLRSLRRRESGFRRLSSLTDTHNPDVVVVLVDINAHCGSSSGIGSIGDHPYAVVDWDCAFNKLSLTHEIGHVLGARHEPTSDNDELPFQFGHGYVIGDDAGWGTIMTDTESCGCVRMPIWSNPRLKHGGAVMGSSACCDNARLISCVVSHIAAKRRP